MLEELHVRDLALIDEAWIEFGPGLTVLTGETGAGKTVLVGALKLLLGERGDASLVRSRASEALVEGRVVIDGTERTVRRRIAAEGRSKCYLDGAIATVADLASTLGPLVDLHGQHEHQAILTPARHAMYLDRFAGSAAAGAMAGWREAFATLADARAEADSIAASLADRDRQLDYLRFQVREIEAIDPAPAEDDELEARLPRLRHGESLASAASTAWRELSADGAARDRGAQGASALRSVRDLDPALDQLAGELDAALAALDDLAGRLRDYGAAVDYEPEAMNETQARLAALATLKKKYGPTLAGVLDTARAAGERIDALEAGEEGLAVAEAVAAEALDALRHAGRRLAAARHEAADRFGKRLGKAASDLAMRDASFEVALEDLPEARWTAEGPQRVEFLFSPAAGEPARPLARIASGGEISRVMLALKSVLGEADTVEVLVFDEIDAGIGGKTATSVGRRLAQLAVAHQVLVITHLAQVAAFADTHLSVTKQTRDGRTVTSVTPISGPDRIAEIARMLSGSDTDASLAHARELLADASPGSAHSAAHPSAGVASETVETP